MPIATIYADKFRNPVGLGLTTPLFDGDGYYVAQGFDTAVPSQGGSYNLGVNWAGETGSDSDAGDAVYGAANGTVVDVVSDQGGSTTGFGNYVVLRHDLAAPITVNGQTVSTVYSLYAHLGTVSTLTIGDQVNIGDQIGTIGTSGATDGSAFLHFEITLGATLPTSDDGYNPAGAPAAWVDPVAFIDSFALEVERVSVSSAGAEGDLGTSYYVGDADAVSSDGRYVVFSSGSTNLVAGDTNGLSDIFIRDRQTGVTDRVSIATGGAEANDLSMRPSVSDDGRYISFVSDASNLVAGDTNGVSDIFVHDRQTGITERVSISGAAGQGSGASIEAKISSDGRYVSFASYAPDLVAGDTNATLDIFVHDRVNGTTQRVSVATGGAEANGGSFDGSMSADGRFISFTSGATNLVAGDTNGRNDVFVHDLQTGVTERVSVSSTGAQATDGAGETTISATGRYVTFSSYSANLVAGDSNSKNDVFVHDRVTGLTERVSVASDGTQGNDNVYYDASISSDGRYVSFTSYATNLVADDTNAWPDVFVHDRITGLTQRVSVAPGGEGGINGGLDSTISADGQYIVFDSLSANLVAGDTNTSADTFIAKNPLYSSTSALATLDQYKGTTGVSDPDLYGDFSNTVVKNAFIGLGGTVNTTRISETSDRYVLQNVDNTGRTTVISGSGFTFDVNGPTAGTITDIQFYDGSTLLATYSWLSLDAATAEAIMDGFTAANIAQQFNTLFAGYGLVYDASGAKGAVTYSGAGMTGAMMITGSSKDDTLTGGNGSDVLSGGNGNDTLNGGGGADNLVGGFGADALYGNAHDDILFGEGGADILFGGGGDDTLYGGDSTDSLYGGAGVDRMDGGNNSDVFYVDGNDIVNDTGVTGYDKAQITNTAGDVLNLTGWSGVERVNGNIGNDTIDGSSQTVALVLSGGNGDDTLIGGDAADVLMGGANDDILIGGDGADKLLGGTGNDTFDGGAGNDIFYIGENGDAVTDGGTGFDKAVINNAAGLSLNIGAWLNLERINGYSGNDTIDATGMATAITIAGGSGNDTLTGGAGNDTLYGGNNDDALNGGAGDDILLGGAGADDFVFLSGFGQDTVVDYLDGTDQLDFQGHAGVNGLGDLVISQSGAHTTITLLAGGTDQITLLNVLATDLDSGDFLF